MTVLVNLALLTGNLGRPGSGTNPLREQNNVRGVVRIGCNPATLIGTQSTGQTDARFEQVWGARLPAVRGLDVVEMVDAAQTGWLKVLWVIGYNIYLSLANASATAAVPDALDLVIIQDLFINQTAAVLGTVFLPAASASEKEGTFMSLDRRVQRIYAITTAPGQVRSDWWIIQALATRMGKSKGFGSGGPEQIWDEARAFWPGGAGLAYSRPDGGSLHWPCSDKTHAGAPAFHRRYLSGGKTAALMPVAYVPMPRRSDDDHPFLLTTGRVLKHSNAGTMSYRTSNAALRPSDMLDTAPADVIRHGFIEGDVVRVISRYDSAVLPLHTSHTMQTGQLLCSFHRAGLLVNRLTPPM